MAPHAPLEEHSKQLVAKLKMADEAVDVARAKALGKSREQFNQSRIEEKLLPGGMVRYFRRLTARRGVLELMATRLSLARSVNSNYATSRIASRAS